MPRAVVAMASRCRARGKGASHGGQQRKWGGGGVVAPVKGVVLQVRVQSGAARMIRCWVAQLSSGVAERNDLEMGMVLVWL
ncbi:unnamed protein product [Sphenostylis stenocarpa]|uniref:Uncharacterized protein n=1 Tax=Sphenostylis stenocarpa TaxID=92480 RepID=A0AA86VB00_9FABA|nr:unnamed protein product [Sphenostylis stenocarpa]